MHDVPKPIFPDGVVLVTQAVAERSYLRPGLTRHKGSGQITQFGGSLAGPFEATLNRIAGFLVLLERRRIHPGDVSLNRLRVFDDV